MFEDAIAPTQRILDALTAMAPKAILALGMLALGLIFASLTRRFLRWGVRRSGLEALAERHGVSRPLYALGYPHGLAQLLGSLGWLGVTLVTAAAIAEMLGLPGVAEGIAVAVEFLPRVVSAGVVLLTGVVSADILRRLVRRAGTARGDVDSPEFFAQGAYYVLLTVTFALAAEQLGLEVGLVNALIQIAAAAGLFALGLSFALSSRPTFGNLLARHHVERLHAPGTRIRVGELEGTVLRYTVLNVIVSTPQGQVFLPCERLLEQAVLRLDGDPPSM